ncbi:Spore coat protein SA [compost metagenome]
MIFAGGIPHSDIHRLYQAADCFVCPSQRHESFGLVNVEAMAAALPVIASRIGGIGEVIEHGRTGLLVDRYREASAFARAIESLARAPKTAAAMGLEGRRTALQAFDWERTASRLELLFAGLCRAREHSPARREYDAPSGSRDSLPTRSLQGSHTLPEML